MAGYDAAVIGLGAMGAATLYHLARRGARVVGLERYEPGHGFGSSHGLTRIIRLGYFEHPAYVPLLRRAYALWRELEGEAGRSLLHVTGILELGPPDGSVVAGTLAAARTHGLSHDVLDARAVMERFPAFRVPDHVVGVLQPDGGFLDAEASVQAHVTLAQTAGAELRMHSAVQGIEAGAAGVRITTLNGVIEAARVVVTVGPWLGRILPELAPYLRVTRQVVGWFAPREPALFAIGRFPVFLLESAHGIHYGFPLQPAGLKIAKHFHADEAVDPDTVDRAVTAADEQLMRAPMAEHLPAADGPLRTAMTCLYTMAPDGHFIIDRLPDRPNVIVASACSGHGFKFAGVVGEAAAELATAGATQHDLARFALARLR